MRRIETFEWWEELVGLKDELSLRELAEKFSVTPGAISAAFKRTGTTRQPAPPGPRALRHRGDEGDDDLPENEEESEIRAPDAPRPGSKDKQLQDLEHMLGRVPDSAIAEQAGVSVRTVAAYRARHEIPGYSGPRRRLEGSQSRAWRVVIRTDDGLEHGVVIAATIADAARVAVDLGDGEVEEISLVGDLLS